MRDLIGTLLVMILMVGVGIGSAAPPAAVAETRVCPVCRVREGPREPEEVRAWRTHETLRYGFCSEKCAREFATDPAAYTPPTFPRPAPALPVSDLGGAPLAWEGLKGRVVLVDFWATWCAPCRKSMPELQALHDRHSARGFMVVGVSIDEGKALRKVRKFVSSRNITYPIAIDAGSPPAWERFRVKAVPAAFLVDRQGRIVAQWTGQSADVRELEQKLVSLLAPAD